MSVEQRLRDAELAFLNAPFEPDGWRLAVGNLLEIIGGVGAQVIGLGGPTGYVDVTVADLHDPHAHLTNPEVFGPCNFRIGAADGRSRIQYEPHFEAYRARHDTSLYDDVVSDLDTRFGCQASLMADSSTLFGLVLFRSRRQGACDPDTIERFTRLAFHAQRSLRVQLALGQQSAELMLEGLAGSRDATILLDRHGAIAAMTEAAETLFDHPHGLRLDGLLLRLALPKESLALEAALARLLASDGHDGPLLHEVRVGRSADRPRGRWRLHLVRLPPLARALGFEPHFALTLTPLAA